MILGKSQSLRKGDEITGILFVLPAFNPASCVCIYSDGESLLLQLYRLHAGQRQQNFRWF